MSNATPQGSQHGLPSYTAYDINNDFTALDLGPLETGRDFGDLPGYSASTVTRPHSGPTRLRRIPIPPKDFEYRITRRGQDVVKLVLLANGRASKDSPTFVGRDPIAGNVHLKLDKPTAIKSITITICGRCLPTAGYFVETDVYSGNITFMDILHTVWSSENTSRAPDSISGGLTPDGKLSGEYLWSFSVPFPATLVAPTTAGDVSFVPPQTFKEQYCAMVVYDITLRIKRTWPNADYKIEIPFNYIPAICPSEFPLLRRLAYESGNPLPAPCDDPEGWYALTPLHLTGTLFKTRPLSMECTLFLAKPLQYTRGTEVPLFMCITSHSRQALDLMCASASTAFNVRLKWRISLCSLRKGRNNGQSIALTGSEKIQNGTSGKAVWWPPTSLENERVHSGRYSRYIRGELRIKNGSKPSSAMPYMKIEYFVSLLQFSPITGIELDADNDKILQMQSVEIGTMYGPGVIPKRHNP